MPLAGQADVRNKSYPPLKLRNGTASKSNKRLVVGVVGHRNFASDDARLSAIVSRELHRLVSRYGGMRLAVLTQLAEGADRMVARIAMKEFGAELFVVLPLPQDLFVQDFADVHSRLEFNALAARGTVLPPTVMFSREVIRRYTEERNHQYAWAGAFVARQCQVLLALWDGKAARGTGGTAQIAEWFQEGATPQCYRFPVARRIDSASGSQREFIHIDPNSGCVRRQRLLT